MVVQARPEMTPDEMPKFGHSGAEEFARLSEQLSRATKERIDHPDDQAFALRAEIFALQERLFLVEHDNAGAFKFKKFGRKIQEMFKPGPDGEPAARLDEGVLRLAESQARRRILLVNMGELDRFNKEGGGHAAGDEALTATSIAVERIVEKALKGKKGPEADYSMYRFDGNTFAVDLADISEAEADALEVALREAQPSVEGVKDPAPLTVQGIDFSQIAELVNHIQVELPKGARLDSEEEAAREMVEVLRRAADWTMEAQKFQTRAERMHEKITEGDLAAAETFFENYAKKAFQDTELGTFAQFKAAVEDPEYPEIVSRLALSGVEKRFAAGRKVDDQFQEIVDARVRERGIPFKPAAEEGEYVPHVPERPPTGGIRLLEEKRSLAEAAEAAAKERPDDQMAVLRAKKLRIEQQIEVARRDAGTGLLDRGVHYEELEQALEDGKDVAAVFVDMGFLKYFDQMGGSDVGDDALRTAASLMEQAIANAGVEGTAYRYGGDEFTIQVEGGAKAAQKVLRELEDLRKGHGPIGRTAKSRAEYAPTELSFNYGLSDRAMLDELYRIDAASGKYDFDELDDPKRVQNIKAELMTKAADVGIEYNKAYSRFKLLIEKLRDPDYASDPDRKMQVDSLITFSNKALFSELGGTVHLKNLAADRSLEGEALEEAILDYVVDKVAETRARESGQKQLMDVLLAAQTKVAFLESRLAQLEEKYAKLELLNEEQHDQIADARRARNKAEEEKLKIIQARKDIDRAA